MHTLPHFGPGAGAGAPALAAAAAPPRQYLTFMLGGEVYGLGILVIKEIIEYGGLTTVPMMPAAIRGVINLRGAVVPVLDLAARFGRPASELGRRSAIVIVEAEAEAGEGAAGAAAPQVVGVLVDAVNAVLHIDAADIEPAPSFGARIRADFIAGMGKVNGKFVILLEAAQVLSIGELSRLANAANATGAAAPEPA